MRKCEICDISIDNLRSDAKFCTTKCRNTYHYKDIKLVTNMYKIYRLIYKGDVVYVGQTKKELEVRKKIGYHFNNDVDLIKNECIIELIEETEDISRERYWISYYRDMGVNLLNIMSGDGIGKKEYNKKHKADNAEHYREYRRNYREKNKDRLREYNKEYKKSLKLKKEITYSGI